MASLCKSFCTVGEEQKDAIRLRIPMAMVMAVAGVLVAISAAMDGKFKDSTVCMSNGYAYPDTLAGMNHCQFDCGDNCYTPTDTEETALRMITVVSILLLFMSGVYFFIVAGEGAYKVTQIWLSSLLLAVIGSSMVLLLFASVSVLIMSDRRSASEEQKQILKSLGAGTIIFALVGLLYPLLVVLRMLIASVMPVGASS